MSVLWVNKDIVIAIFDVELGEELLSFKFVQLCLNIRHVILVADGDVIQLPVIYNHMEIFFFLLVYNKDQKLILRWSFLDLPFF
jgi:hypothetical protein